jgi:FG-GAP-like repeat
MKRFVPQSLIVVLFVLIGCTTQSQSQGALFVPASNPITVGPGGGEVELADLNRDGHLDMITKHLLEKKVSVLLGNGKGNFVPVSERPMNLEYEPGAIALADINNDGILDLCIASRDAQQEYLRIFRGDGKGGFSLSSGSPFIVNTATKGYKPSINIVDIDEDGMKDLMVANGRRNTIEILFGDGRGGVSRRTTTRLESGRDRYSLALGDVDRDGHLDLITISIVESGSVPSLLLIRRGDGKGAFNEYGSPISSVPDSRIGTLADLDANGSLDIVVTHDNYALSVWLDQGKGKFASKPTYSPRIGGSAFGVIAADINQDHRKDLIAATQDSITVLLGYPAGFVSAPGSPFSAGPGTYNLSLGDINRDGKLDAVASAFEGNAVTVLMGQ